MTMDDLNKVIGLRKEIEMLDLQIKDLETWGSVPSSRNPFASSGSGTSIPNPSDPTAAYAHKMQKLKDLLLSKKAELIEKLVEVEFWIQEISDPLVQSIIRSHYLMGRTWRQTARECCGSNDKSTPYKVVARFFTKK